MCNHLINTGYRPIGQEQNLTLNFSESDPTPQVKHEVVLRSGARYSR